MPESDREDMEVFLEKMQQILPVLGVEAFLDKSSSTAPAKQKRELLSCNIKGLVATGYLTPNGILVLQGSQAVLEERASAQKWPSVLVQRNRLIEEGVLVEKAGAYVFAKDVEFASPSSAAATVHGGSANGLTAWVNRDGIQLKRLEDSLKRVSLKGVGDN